MKGADQLLNEKKRNLIPGVCVQQAVIEGDQRVGPSETLP